jgi:hypothetical protein
MWPLAHTSWLISFNLWAWLHCNYSGSLYCIAILYLNWKPYILIISTWLLELKINSRTGAENKIKRFRVYSLYASWPFERTSWALRPHPRARLPPASCFRRSRRRPTTSQRRRPTSQQLCCSLRPLWAPENSTQLKCWPDREIERVLENHYSWWAAEEHKKLPIRGKRLTVWLIFSVTFGHTSIYQLML